MTVGVIPARARSAGAWCKNKRFVGGKPLFWYACVAALDSNLAQVYLDTDDEDIIAYVRTAFPSIIIPYTRPATLATGSTTALQVAQNFIANLRSFEKPLPEALCWLQPTSPLRTSTHINRCLDLIGNADSVVSVVDVGSTHPLKVKVLSEEGYLLPQDPARSIDNANRQELPPMYVCNGAIFLARLSTLLEQKSFYGAKCRAFVMDRRSSLNVDDEIDLTLADTILKMEKQC